MLRWTESLKMSLRISVVRLSHQDFFFSSFLCLFVLFNTLSWTFKWLAWYEPRRLVSLWCGLSVSVLMLLLAVPFSVSSVSVFASCFSVWLCYACVFYSCQTNCVPLSCSVWDVSWAECSSSTESLKKPSYSPFSCEGQTNACFTLLCLIPFPGKDSIKNLPFCYFLWKILDCFNKSSLLKRLLSHFCCVYPSFLHACL